MKDVILTGIRANNVIAQASRMKYSKLMFKQTYTLAGWWLTSR